MKRSFLIYLLLLCSISIFAQGVVTPPRTCTVCKVTKPASEFSGQSKTCKACAKKKPETRTCSSCKKTKVLSAFSGSSKVCKECAIPKTKICSVCQKSKPVAEFSRNSNECKECESLRITIEENQNDYVDLGLPSGTLWATRNIGANSPKESGDYFAWGETKGYKSGKTVFTWITYKWSKGDKNKLTKYCDKSRFGNNGFTDNKIELDLEDDAAYVNWGSNWRMPSIEQQNELREKCTWKWVTYKGTSGYVVKGSNGKSIFLPAAGLFDEMSLDHANSGCYWSRTLYTSNQGNPDHPEFARRLDFSNNAVKGAFAIRNVGLSVRPVRITQQEVDRIAREQAEKESIKKFNDLGDDYRYGRNGKSKDYVEAVKWYRKAAEQGCAEAQYNLGFMYASGDGVTQNYSEAVKWCRKAAEQGNADAHNALGNMYMMGRGVTKDYTEAVKWFSKAAEQGDTNAQNNLGRVYHEGLGVTKNDIEAVKWFRKSAEQGNVHAQINMSYMYEFGYGVTKDISQAKYWCEKAAAQGNEYAKKKLKDLKKK